MTEKELHRLRRQDLLQLLLAQGKEAAELQSRLDEAQSQLEELQETKERFIGRMNEKDAQIEKLKNKLNEKDAQIESFKTKLDEKDAQIEKLKGRLDEKDLKIQELKKRLDDYLTRRKNEFDEVDSIAEIGTRLNNIFALAQEAVGRKLEEKGGQKLCIDSEGGRAATELQESSEAEAVKAAAVPRNCFQTRRPQPRAEEQSFDSLEAKQNSDSGENG